LQRLGLFHALHCQFDRLQNTLIPGAAAAFASDPLAYFLFRGRLLFDSNWYVESINPGVEYPHFLSSANNRLKIHTV